MSASALRSFTSRSAAKPDLHHGVYYAADDLAGCIIEVFGDRGEIEDQNYGGRDSHPERGPAPADLNR